MKTGRIAICILSMSVLAVLLCGCGMKEKETVGGSEPSGQASIRASETGESETVTPQTSSQDVRNATEDKMVDAAEGSQSQIDEVRQAFLALQKVCKANDVEGYLDMWDFETKMAIDGRDLDLNERRERRRNAIMTHPEQLQKIAGAKIRSITVDTSKAEGIKALFGVDLKGTMMIVQTDGPSLFFHDTDKGWKLNSIHYVR